MAQLKKKEKQKRKNKNNEQPSNPRHPFVIVKALNFMFPL